MRGVFFLRIASLLGFLAVLIGAFAAHQLKPKLNPVQANMFETAVRYHFYHTIALLIVGVLSVLYNVKFIAWSGWFFLSGIVLFSGSLYTMVLLSIQNVAAPTWFGVLTPIGGLGFLGGWACLFLSVSKIQS